MKDALLGANHWLSCFATCHAVTPPSEPLSSGHLSAAPPHGSIGIPRFFWYQAARALGSPVLLKKTPPIPVTLAMLSPQPAPRSAAGGDVCAANARFSSAIWPAWYRLCWVMPMNCVYA